MEHRIWKIFQFTGHKDLEQRLFYSIVLLSAVALFLLGLFLLNWPEPLMGYYLLALAAFFALLAFSHRSALPLVAAQLLYLAASLYAALSIYQNSGGLKGPVLMGLLLAFLTLLTTTRSQLFKRSLLVVFILLGVYLIYGAAAPDWTVTESTTFFAVYLFFTLIFYLGTVYLKLEYDRIASELRAQRDALEVGNRKYKEQVQAISELNAQKSRLFSIIGHDLRSPLSGIEGLLHLLAMDSNQDDEQAAMRQDLLRLTRNSRTLLDNLLFWSRREDSAYEPSWVDYPSIIKMVVDYLEPIAASKKVKLQTLVEPNEGKVWNDPQMLEMVLRNLVQNAIKFTPSGGWVKLRAYETGSQLLLEVEDNGLGMTKEQQEALFTDHREVRQGTAQEKGVGLGLKLCDEFVQQMEGEIKLRSLVGKGTCFTIHLPRGQANA